MNHSMPGNMPPDAYVPMSAAHMFERQHEAVSPHRDALTDLPNRAALEAELNKEIITQPGRFALVFIDVDGLKQTNDAFGHRAGDELITKTADTLLEVTRGNSGDQSERQPDTVAEGAFRLAGDEFIVLLRGVTTQEQVDRAMERLQDALSARNINASMGGRPHRTGESLRDLVESVDALMYEQKRTRKSEMLRIRREALLQGLTDEQRAAVYAAHLALEKSGVSTETFSELFSNGK